MASANRKREIVLAALDTFECRLLRYAQRLLRDEHAARDTVQHTFLKLLDANLDDVEPRMGKWLFTVCRNRAMDVLRQRQREAGPSSENGHHALPKREGVNGTAGGNERRGEAAADYNENPADRAEQADLHAHVQKAMADLPANAREPLALWAEGFTYCEIAEILQQNESTLRVVVHRALLALKAHPLLQSVLT
jgi:RNA polymerase sigma factor (sigma-70 family)